MASDGKWRLEKDDKFENAIFPIPGEYDDQSTAMQAAEDLIRSEQSLGELSPTHFAYIGDQKVPEYDRDRLIVVGPDGTRIRVNPTATL